MRVCSSVVERYVDIVEVISSILITPTIKMNVSCKKLNLGKIYFKELKYFKMNT